MSTTPYNPVLTDQMQMAAVNIALITATEQRAAWIVFLLQELEGQVGTGQLDDLLRSLQDQVNQRLAAGSWPSPAAA